MESVQKPHRFLIVLCCVALGCGACSPGSTSGSPSAAGSSGVSTTPQQEPRIKAVASVYPIAWLIDQIGGEKVEASVLTPQGAEPWGYTYSEADLGALNGADVLFYVAGFQPSLDAAVGQLSAPSVNLEESAKLVHHRGLASNHGDESSEAGRQLDPYFWQDPVRFSLVAEEISQSLTNMDPENSSLYAQNLAQLKTALEGLDTEFSQGLSQCASHAVVSYRAAYAYLTDRYHLNQVAVRGIDPSIDPTQKDLRMVKLGIAEGRPKAIFDEAGKSNPVMTDLAGQTGTQLASLDTVTSEPAMADYLAAMRANLESLRGGLGCV